MKKNGSRASMNGSMPHTFFFLGKMTIMHINGPGIRLDLKHFGFATKMLLITNLLQWVKIMFTILGEKFTFYILHNEFPLKFNFILTIMIIVPLKHFDGLSKTEQGFFLPSLQTFVPHC